MWGEKERGKGKKGKGQKEWQNSTPAPASLSPKWISGYSFVSSVLVTTYLALTCTTFAPTVLGIAGIVFSGVRVSVCLFVQKLRNYWSQIGLTCTNMYYGEL